MLNSLNPTPQTRFNAAAPPAMDMMPDWGVGQYETFARELEPTAASVVELAAIGSGEEVLDIGCGTGNATLLAARSGAVTVGVDRSPRLIEVARARAAAEGVGASFVVGDAQALPFADDEFDLALSVFGVIYVADSRRAASELLRILRPEGRALICAWLPGGALDEMVRVIVGAVSSALGFQIPQFPWHDATAVGTLVAPLGIAERVYEGELAFSAQSPESYLELQEGDHPMTIAARDLLQRVGTYEAVRSQILAALRDGNEDPQRFRTTCRYCVIRLRRSSAWAGAVTPDASGSAFGG
jgi:SAM-dependent methyltransferase